MSDNQPIDPRADKPAECPWELWDAITEFWPEAEWQHAADIARLESAYNAFAVLDSTSDTAPCGAVISSRDGIIVTAELSVGYFQINACNFPGWEWQRLYNARHNAGTAHMIWGSQGWRAWYFSAQALGLL